LQRHRSLATVRRRPILRTRHLISNDSQLAELLPHLTAVERVALDTEADSLHVYREKLCLIQLSLPGDIDALVDPLGDFSLQPFYAALEGKLIVLHGADYDLRLLRRAGGFVADAVFDTMLAARLLGRREFSYAALVQAEFAVTLTKGSQKANWARRPLTAAMAAYAQNDTRYLLALAERLEAGLRAVGRWDWFEQSCARALTLAAIEKERDGEEAWRISGSGILRGLAAAIFRELWRWRDQEARHVDRPSFHILRNEELLAAAKEFAGGQNPRFDHLRGSRRDRFYEAVERARQLPESAWPMLAKRPFSRWTAEEEKRAAALKNVRDKAAAELDLDPSIIAARATLETLAVRAEAAADLLMPWQRSLLNL
jgi:ribonuclease D